MKREKAEELQNRLGFVVRDIENLKETSFDLDCILESLSDVIYEVIEDLKEEE